jgi:hypothetical protein
MEPLRLHATYESEPQFALLVEQLRLQLARPDRPAAWVDGSVDPAAKALAHWLYLRLWVALAMDAAAHSDPGLLRAAVARIYERQFHEAFCSTWNIVATPLTLLVEATVLVREDGDFRCPAFNHQGLNETAAGNFVKKERKGGLMTSLATSAKQRDATAQHIALGLLSVSDTEYRDTAGQLLNLNEKRAAVNFVLTLERCLRVPNPRQFQASHWPAGFIAQAVQLLRETPPDSLLPLYHWLQEHQGQPGCPRTADECLALWSGLLVRAGIKPAPKP